MSKLQRYLIKYIDCYVDDLTKGKEEFFLSFCDIEEELLTDLDISPLQGYCVVVVNGRNYSEAVKMRNRPDVNKIVLLSGEGVKQIDSLKDFNEYSILGTNYASLWEYLGMAMQLVMRDEDKNFLTVIMNQSEVSFSALMEYLEKSTSRIVRTVGKPSQIRFLQPRRMNENLPMLGIWKSRKEGVLNKGEIGRILRASRYNVIESRLTKAILDGKLTDPKEVRTITSGLAAGDVEKILKNIYYEDMEKFLKGTSRGQGAGGSSEDAKEEVVYECSYQYKLLTSPQESIAEIEQKWMEDRDQEDADTEQEWDKYRTRPEWFERLERQICKIRYEIQGMNLPFETIQWLLNKLEAFYQCFLDSKASVLRATPVCLKSFCSNAQNYVREYVELLVFFLQDKKAHDAAAGISVLQDLQTCFCEVYGSKIMMPFYHPICVFYYMGIKNMYQFALEHQRMDDISEQQSKIWLALIRRTGMQFPIEFFLVDKKRYMLDYSTVWQSGAVEFIDMDAGTVYSALDFRAVTLQILNYLERHPFLTHVKVALVDISGLAGLIQLVNRILHSSQLRNCNIGRVEFLILSAKEDELRRQMAEIWDTVGTDEVLRFRFGRNEYWNGKKYDLERIVEEMDMTIIADSSMLYREPRMIPYQNNANSARNRLKNISVVAQADRYFSQGVSDINVIWDSLQHVMGSQEDGFWIWKSQEIDNGLLTYMNEVAAHRPDKAIVMLSSNEQILTNIHRTEFIHARRGRVNGKSVTIISFENENVRKELPQGGKADIVYSMRDFYYTALGLDEIQEAFSPNLKDVLVELYFQEDVLECGFHAIPQDDERDLEGDWADLCGKWFYWQIVELSFCPNILGKYYRDIMLYYWHGQIQNLPTVLMVEKINALNYNVFRYGERNYDIIFETKKENDCMEALKIHEMIQFAETKEGIDERAVSQFADLFDSGLLERVLRSNDKHKLLIQETRDKLYKIHEKIRKE